MTEKVKFKIVQDLGTHTMGDSEPFHMAKVEFSYGETRIAAFTTENFQHMQRDRSDGWIQERPGTWVEQRVYAPEWIEALATDSHMGEAKTGQNIPMLRPHPKFMNWSTWPYSRSYDKRGRIVADTSKAKAEEYKRRYKEAAQCAVRHFKPFKPVSAPTRWIINTLYTVLDW